MEKRIILIGVGHVFDISDQIETVIDRTNPDIAALELDKDRLSFLMNPDAQRGKLPFSTESWQRCRKDLQINMASQQVRRWQRL